LSLKLIKKTTLIAKELISYYIPAVSFDASGDDALSIMEEHKLNHIPLVKNNNYQGILSENTVLEFDDPSLTIAENKPNLMRPFVNVYSHIFDIIKILAEFRLTCIPVLDDNEEYLGLITIQDMAFQFAKITNAVEPGGVLILGINIRDYSLSQAAQIVESDNAKILSSYLSATSDTTELDLILKINKSDLSIIIKSFERFNYKIKASFHESAFEDDLRDKFNQFMRYLNM